MRIEGWHVDGFGVLRDHEVRGLGAGLTAFLGPNEAGKSTLLAFLRGVLVGYPSRGAAAHYPPLHGGRHGGRVFLRGPDGEVTVERMVGSKAPVVVTPTGVEHGDEAVRRLLGGVDAGLFSSVFAFSLTELQDLRSLTEEGVRDRIFSAGIAGAGRSARHALVRLDKEASELARPLKGGAANKLIARLTEAEARAAEARAAAAEYPELLQAENEARARVEAAQAEVRSLRDSLRRCEVLRELWPVYCEGEGARGELEALAAGAEPALWSRVEDLAEGLGVYQDRAASLPEAEAAAARAAAAVERRLAALGQGWDEGRLASVDISVPRGEEVREWGALLASSSGTLDERRRERDAAAGRVLELKGERDRLLARLERDDASEDGPGPEAEAAEAALHRLRSDAQEVRALEARLEGLDGLAADRELSLRGTEAAAAGRADRAVRVSAVLALVAAVAGAGAVWWGHPVWGVVFGSAAVLLAAAAYVARRAPGGAGRAAADVTRARASLQETRGIAAAVRDRLHAVTERMAADAVTVGLASRPGFADIEARAAEMDRARDRRRARDELLARLEESEEVVARAVDSAARADALLSGAHADHSDLQSRWSAWSRSVGAPADLTPDGVAEFLRAARSAHEALGVQEEARERVERLGAETGTWETAARALLSDAGREPGGTAAAVLVEFRRLRDDCGRAAARHGHLTALVDTARQALDSRLGHGAEAEGLRSELATGRVEEWAAAAERAEEELSRAEGRATAEIRLHRDAERARQLQEESSDVPARELEVVGIRTELERVLHRWQVLVTARALIDETLAEYSRTRRPPVLTEASTHLSRVTGGAYAQIVEDDSGDGFVVVDSCGGIKAPEHLSRGTLEQLYLSLRLGLAAEFTRRAGSVPVIMDDVLVNFDPDRARATAEVLVSFAAEHQVLFFTCHPATVGLLTDLDRTVGVVELGFGPPGREPLRTA